MLLTILEDDRILYFYISSYPLALETERLLENLTSLEIVAIDDSPNIFSVYIVL